MKKRPGINTMLQHAGYTPREHGWHLNPPLYLDIAPVQPSIEEAAGRFADAKRGFTYFRKGHENARILERKLAEIEGGDDALAFATGMAAMNCLMLELIKRGGRLVAQRGLYGGTTGFLTHDFRDAGRRVSFIGNALDIAEWKRALRANADAALIEMPSNPTVGLADVETIAALCGKKSIPLVVDSTFAPLLWKPIEWGATFVIRSGSKYENPGNTSMLGIVIGPSEAIDGIRNGRYERYGAPAGASECWLAELGLRTLYIRMQRQSASALAVARFLSSHPAVTAAHYPGLAGSCYRRLAEKYLPDGCGAVLAFELAGGIQACRRFMRRIRIFQHVINLGDTRSLATYPAGTTHSKLSKAERKAAGISDSLIRLSVGLEDVSDLLDDLDRALR